MIRRKEPRRFWTEDDLEFVRTHYRTLGGREIAKRLRRSVVSVYQTAAKLGLSQRPPFLDDRTVIAGIRELHAKGLTDAEIARELSRRHDGIACNRHRVGFLRERLKLPLNVDSAHSRAMVAEKTREQLAAAGLSSLAELRGGQWDAWKRSQGWPIEWSIRAVQAAELFLRHGPMTRIQLCLAMGIEPRKRTDPTSNKKGGTVLAELQRAGVLVRLRKVVPPNSIKPVPVDLYFLDEEVVRNVRQQNA